jgi:hypothetical protein
VKDMAIRPSDERLIGRIRGEYMEMLGLQLTCEQAQRLFGLSASQCVRVLDDLVSRKFLVRSSDGRYAQWAGGETRRSTASATSHRRAGEGSVTTPREANSVRPATTIGVLPTKSPI